MWPVWCLSLSGQSTSTLPTSGTVSGDLWYEEPPFVILGWHNKSDTGFSYCFCLMHDCIWAVFTCASHYEGTNKWPHAWHTQFEIFSWKFQGWDDDSFDQATATKWRPYINITTNLLKGLTTYCVSSVTGSKKWGRKWFCEFATQWESLHWKLLNGLPSSN